MPKKEIQSVNISNFSPDAIKIVDEVVQTRKPVLLMNGDQPLAVMKPMPRRRPSKSIDIPKEKT